MSLQVSPDCATEIILATMALHNFIKCKVNTVYNSQDHSMSGVTLPLAFTQQGGNMHTKDSRTIIEELTIL